MSTISSLMYKLSVLLLLVNTITAKQETWDYHDRTCDTAECLKDTTVAYGDCKLSDDKNDCNGINCKFIGNSNIRICVNPTDFGTELSELSDDEMISRIKESAVSIGSQQLCLYDEQGNVYDMLCKRFGGKQCDPDSKKCAMDYKVYQRVDAILEPLKKESLTNKLPYDYTDDLLIVIDGTSTKEQFEENEYDAVKGGEYLMSKKARWHNGNWANHASNFYEDYQGAKYYWYGPDNSAKIKSAADEIRDLVEGTTNTICDFVANHTNTDKKVNVDIIGYSRGGYVAMESARKIERYGCDVNSELINIRFMGLYDPVSSILDITTNGINGGLIDGVGDDDGLYVDDTNHYVADIMPTNVQHIAISYGNPKLGSRAYFNTLENKKNNKKRNNVEVGYFNTTHSGIGGGPMEGDYKQVLEVIQGDGWRELLRAVYGLVLDDVEKIPGYGAKMECTESMKADLHIRSAAHKHKLPITATKEAYYDFFEGCPKA